VAVVVAGGCRTGSAGGQGGQAGRARGTTTTVVPPAAAIAPPCSPARPEPTGQKTVPLVFDGKDRDYIVRVPSGYDGTTAAPVVFDFHGWGSNAIQQLYYGSYMSQSDRDGFVIVAPDGIDDPSGRHYNIGAAGTPTDDVAFVLTVLDQVESRLCIDPARVFATGMSDGGAMTSALACRASDRFAAFGAVALVLYAPGCAPSRPVPIAAFMGTADPIVPFDGGAVRCCGGTVLPSAPGSMAGWAQHNGCKRPEEKRLFPAVLLRVWPGCRGGADVRFYIIEGGGHTWPGTAFDVGRLGVTNKDISASDTLWAFFQAHPLPARTG
jgi:polyhydroxybutyrate depolymerase